MIESDLIATVYSEIVNDGVYSEDVPDFRTLDMDFRLLENGQQRDLEDDSKRILE
jgi:hypothetical protein